MPQTVAAWAVAALGATGYAATIVYAVAYVGTAYALTYASQQILAPSSNKLANQQNRQVNGGGVSNNQGVIGGAASAYTVRQSAAPRRLIYGHVKTGGVLVYPKKTPLDWHLHLAIYLGEGPIEGLTGPVYLGDRRSTDAQLSGLVDRAVYKGAPGQTYSAALAAVSEGEWTSAMVGNGCAWVHTVYTFDRERWDMGPVMPAFEVLGRRCFDPRTGALTPGATSNPALVMLDFIRSEFGYAAPDAWIDFDSFAAAAMICDELVVSTDMANEVNGSPWRVRRYGLNAVFEVDASPAATVQAIEDTCAGKLIFCGGKYKLFVGAYRPASGPALTEQYLRDSPAFRAHPSRQQRINVARGTYTEPRQEWQSTSIHEQVLSDAVIAEDGEIVQSVALPAVTNSAQAQRLARIKMMTARSAVPLILKCNYAAFVWELYDVVYVDLPEIGVGAEFLIVNYAFADIADGGGIDLTLVPHLASDYAWDPQTMERLIETAEAPNFDYPAPGVTGFTQFVQTHVDGFSGMVDRGVEYSWDATDWGILSHYELQVREVGTDWISYQTGEPKWIIQAKAEAEYEARVRNVGMNRKKSAWTAIVTTAVTRTADAANAPDDISVTSNAGHVISWINPGSANFARMNIYMVDGTGLGSPVLITSVSGHNGVRMSFTALRPAGTHYALAPVTFDGVEGALVYAGQGTSDTSQLIAEGVTEINETVEDLNDRVTALEEGD